MEILINIKLIVTLALLVGIKCKSVLESNGTAGEDLDAQTLIALGRELNNPIVTLIGKVIENYHLCTAWSQWTECGARRANFFSIRRRARHCGKDNLGTSRRAQTEISVCEGATENLIQKLCPMDYTTTENGFCLKLYTTEKSHDDAEKVCKNDGGFLINIDSDLKYADVKAFLATNNTEDHMHIDGRRKNAASPWEYNYGSKSGYFNWYSGYPKSDTNYLCLGLSGYTTTTNQRFRTFNRPCSNKRQIFCEIPV